MLRGVDSLCAATLLAPQPAAAQVGVRRSFGREIQMGGAAEDQRLVVLVRGTEVAPAGAISAAISAPGSVSASGPAFSPREALGEGAGAQEAGEGTVAAASSLPYRRCSRAQPSQSPPRLLRPLSTPRSTLP